MDYKWYPSSKPYNVEYVGNFIYKKIKLKPQQCSRVKQCAKNSVS